MGTQVLPAGKKLPKAERRKQLLETAMSIVREEGTDALTLGYLAERAGVSKPIAYEHFKSRPGLLMALYKRIDEQQLSITLEALQRAPRTLEDVARVLSSAYMRCYVSVGLEWHAISAALKGAEEMEIFQRNVMEEYVTIHFEALSQYTNLSNDKLRICCIGIIGAAESISREMVLGKISEKLASDILGLIIVQCFSPGDTKKD